MRPATDADIRTLLSGDLVVDPGGELPLLDFTPEQQLQLSFARQLQAELRREIRDLQYCGATFEQILRAAFRIARRSLLEAEIVLGSPGLHGVSWFDAVLAPARAMMRDPAATRPATR